SLMPRSLLARQRGAGAVQRASVTVKVVNTRGPLDWVLDGAGGSVAAGPPVSLRLTWADRLATVGERCKESCGKGRNRPGWSPQWIRPAYFLRPRIARSRW